MIYMYHVRLVKIVVVNCYRLLIIIYLSDCWSESSPDASSRGQTVPLPGVA